ncbi:28862_t:CDS:2, partial [Dentiscutata erythropus]
MTTDQKHSSDNTLTEQEAIRRTEKIARIFELYEQNSKLKKDGKKSFFLALHFLLPSDGVRFLRKISG